MTPLETAAIAWWRAHRPYGWTETEHLRRPASGIRGNAADLDLAYAVSDTLYQEASITLRPCACVPEQICAPCLRLDDPAQTA